MVDHTIKSALRHAAAAIQFLTRFPLPVTVPFERRTAAGSVVYFPLCGALIGVTGVGAAYLLLLALPPLPAAALTLAIWTALSGGLHLDGWMDTADGVLSHRPRERMLEIMKDSRVGAMGVIAGVLLLLLKFGLLASLFESGLRPAEAAAVICIPVWSRWWMTVAIFGWKYAGGEEGLGSLYRDVRARHAGRSAAVGAVITLVVLAVGELSGSDSLPVAPEGAAAPFAGLLSIALWPAAAAAFGWPLAGWLNRRLGGLTGDTYGALNEWVEAGMLLLAVALAAG